MSATNNWLQTGINKLCRVHFALVGVFVAYIIASDATHLITPEVVLQRWTMTAILLTGISIIWHLSRRKAANNSYYRSLIYVLISLDIIVAGFNIYTQRGMASRAVMLFAIPIAVSAVLLSRSALFMTASLCAATYVLAAVKYFVDFFNEGYKAELYIEVGLYCAVFFVIAGLLAVLISAKTTTSV